MALATVDHQNVERTGTVARQGFTIAASAEAFRILSDGLYSDKVTAVIRELGTNAVDAHIEAGNSEPFIVELPTNDKPWFRIRDYGTGLVHEAVMGLYSTYFGSDKTNNPNVTGQLGLGSKSPLSYARSFSVISYISGQKNQYVVMLNEDRLPEINYLPDQSGPTTEPNGLEVQIAVRTADFGEFARKAANVYRHFTLRPTITGVPDFKIVTPDILVQGKGWRIYSGAGNSKAIMGNIAYPIHADRIHDITAHQRAMLNCNIEIDFPIGALEFTPSRESLAYKKTTSDVLRARLDEIVSEVNAEVARRFDNASSLWEARVLAYSMFWDNDSTLCNLKTLAQVDAITYKGQPIKGQQLTFDKVGVEAFSFKAEKKRRRHFYGDDSGLPSVIKRSPRHYFTPQKNIMWCEADLPRGSFTRCQDAISRGEAKEVYLVSFADEDARKKFCESMGLNGDEFVKTSSLPKPAVQRGVFHRSTSQVYKHTGSTSEARFYRYWKEEEVELDEGGVYVEMRRNQAFVNGRVVNPQHIGEIMDALKAIGHPITVIGVRPTVAKGFRRSDDWVDIFTYAKNVLKTQVVANQLGKRIANSTEFNKVEHSQIWARLIELRATQGIAPNSPFRLFLEHFETLQKAESEVSNKHKWDVLANHTGFTFTGMADYNMAAEHANIERAYPMMATLFDNISRYSVTSSLVSHLVDYVNLIDGKNGIVTT